MKKILYYISAAILVLCMAACSKETTTTPETGRQMTIVANIEEALNTKANLDGNDTEGYQVLWSEGDKIEFQVKTESGKEIITYTLSEGAGTTSGVFTGPALPDGEYTAGYGDNLSMNNGGVLKTELSYSPSMNAGCAPMMAEVTVADGVPSIAKFKNICGLMRLDLKGDNTIKAISITTNEGLGGLIKIEEDGAARVSVDPAPKCVTLDCGENGVELTPEAKPFYISMPKNNYTGVKIEVSDFDGNTCIKTLKADKTLNIARAQITPVSLTVTGMDNVKILSADGTANCYIVSWYGDCKFDATKKGHTNETVGTVASAEVLWESFGNDVQPQVGDVVKNVSVKDGYVYFTASGKDGNAVIAVKDAAGNILWSWHIWVCKGFDPAATAQVYNNNAGTVMDRNLGATSAAKGDVKALGLLYQWGRKDPFLSGQSISSSARAKSTNTWPSKVSSDASNGTIDYVVKHPTTFVTYNSNNYDWYYTGSSSTDNTRWNSGKGMYDPCPTGWRIPDGGSNGLWAKALGSSSSFRGGPWDGTNKGMDFSGKFSTASQVWYPASGYLYDITGTLSNVGYCSLYWSCTPNGYYAYSLYFGYNGNVSPSDYYYRAYGQSVRCLRDGSEVAPAIQE